MASLLYFFFFCFCFLSFCSHIASGAVLCETATCGDSGPEVRFPFRFKDQAESCGYPGFDLSCTQGRIILTLPHSGDFYVQEIDYFGRIIFISDPENCFPQRVLENFSLSGSPFELFFPGNFTFFNCSSGTRMPRSWLIPCIRGYDYMVWMTPTDYVESLSIPSSCRAIVSALLPLSSPGTMQLTWGAPSCSDCEAAGRHCVRKNDRSVDVECSGDEDPSSNGGIPRSVKYGITIGLGIPGLLCLIGLSCYLCGRVGVHRREPQPDAELSSMIIPHRSVLAMGLDRPTIESFPKTLLGESRRLPNPSDNTCPICLSEYQPKEELRTIPECNHYFHANCIDEWLKLNATCPLCRKSPDESASVTSLSSRTSSATASSRTP